MPLFDLHLHSTASDGQLTPDALVRFAKASGVTFMALTDHDNIDGVKEAAFTAEELGISFIPGVELSVDFPGSEMHILGYGIRLEEPLLSYLSDERRRRSERNIIILKKLAELGVHLSEADIVKHAEKDIPEGSVVVVGRPHIAMALVEKGYVADLQEAFSRYIASGAPAYVDREHRTASEAIAVIEAVGGVAFLAHPHLAFANPNLPHAEYDPKAIRSIVSNLVAYGLSGIEALHSDHDAYANEFYSKLASDLGLLISGGSDFHGAGIHPNTKVGFYGEGLPLDDFSIVERLLAKIES